MFSEVHQSRKFSINIFNNSKVQINFINISNLFLPQTIETSLLTLERIYNKTVGNYLIRLFFDAKADEIVSMYSEDAKTRNKDRLIQSLRKISPNNNSKWRDIE